MALGAYLYQRRAQWGAHVHPEQRVQVSAARFRVPEICVAVGDEPKESILTLPPFLCIENLSREDGRSKLQQRVDDYLALGVPNVWMLDPFHRRAWRCSADGMLEARERRTENPEIIVPLDEIFET
jgi:Uma2 family endonuclease